MSDEKKSPLLLKVISIVLTLSYTAACIFLYYRFMGWESGSVYESDLPAHISLAVNDHLIYSLISFIIIGLDKAGAMIALPVILGGFACLSVFFTSKVVMEVTEKKWNRYAVDIMALFLNIFMPCYVKGLSDGRYMGMHTSSIWHNSTYLMMKWMGLWVILLYILIEKKISEKLTLKSFLFFTLILTLTTAAKPNFFLAVTPAMLVFLIIDLVKKKAPVGRLLLFASSVIPSFAVMVLQNGALYDNSADTTEITSIVFAPGRAMTAHTGYLIPVTILSIAFPLMMLVLHIKDLFRNRYMLFAWMCAGFGLLQYFLFAEQGARAQDANLSWGYAFTIILIFGISLILWVKDVLEMLPARTGPDNASKSKEKNGLAGTLKKCALIVSTLVLAYHIYCGLLFFIRLCMGVSYMMWG